MMNAPKLPVAPLFYQLIEQAEAAVTRSDFDTAVGRYEELLRETTSFAGNPAYKALRLKALRERGRLLDLLSQREASLASYEQYYLEAGHTQYVVDALILIGNQLQYMGHYQRAVEAFQEAQQLARAFNNVAGRAHAFCGVGVVQSALGRMEEALEALQTAQALFEQIGNKVEQIRAYNRIGVAYIRKGEMDKAIHAFLACRQLVDEVGDQDPTALTAGVNALNNLGECYQMLYDMDLAVYYHRRGLAIAEGKDLLSQATDLYRNLGVDLFHLGRVDEGLAYLYHALRLSDVTNQPDMKLQTLYSLALAELDFGNLEKGLAHAQALRALAEEKKTRGYQADALHAVGLYHQKKGERLTAEQVWQQALFLAQETGRRTLLWQLHAAMAEIADNPALRDVHYRIAAEVIQQMAFPIKDDALCQKFLNARPVRQILLSADVPPAVKSRLLPETNTGPSHQAGMNRLRF
jgi:tetratricopeptide (TPR) repeat protein